jgi:hypothetical protein
MRGKGAGVDVEVTLEVEIGPVVSPFALVLLLELLDEVLALPGDVGGGVRSTRALISTIAVILAKEPVSMVMIVLVHLVFELVAGPRILDDRDDLGWLPRISLTVYVLRVVPGMQHGHMNAFSFPYRVCVVQVLFSVTGCRRTQLSSVVNRVYRTRISVESISMVEDDPAS